MWSVSVAAAICKTVSESLAPVPLGAESVMLDESGALVITSSTSSEEMTVFKAPCSTGFNTLSGHGSELEEFMLEFAPVVVDLWLIFTKLACNYDSRSYCGIPSIMSY